MNKILKSVLTGILVFAIAFLGVYLGMSFRGMSGSSSSQQSTLTQTKLQVGNQFPSVSLMKSDSSWVQTPNLYENDGAVFLFMEMGCPPCVAMSQKWQQMINNGAIAKDKVVGVIFEAEQSVGSYSTKNDLTFPIYCDTGKVFLKNYDVTEYPYVVVVGKSGKVHFQTYNPRDEISPKELAAKLSD